MSGHGVSHGAISVMNAIPCGIGSTIGIGISTDAFFEPSDRTEIILKDRPSLSTDLASTCVRRTLERIGESTEFRLEVRTDIPPSMGLKSSSSVCNAVISSVLDHYGRSMEDLDLVRLGVECAKECKVTITGAFDDACGCFGEGLVITDNTRNELLCRKAVPKLDVVICVPDTDIPKSKVPVERYRELRQVYEDMVPSIEEDYLDVLTRNGRYVEGIIGTGTGLSERALALGALAAGITGTGPAVAVVAKKGDGKRIAEELGCRYILTETR